MIERSGGRRPLAAATLAATLAVAAGVQSSGAQAPGAQERGKLELHRIARFEQPTFATHAPGEPRTIYVTEQAGRVLAVRKGRPLRRPFLDIRDRVSFGFKEARSVEAGLFSIAFAPDYPRSGRFYVFYTGPGGDNHVDRYRRADGRAVRARRGSRRPVLKVLHPWTDSHNGGQLQFGPDGNLWISTGDGGCCNDDHDQARSLGTRLGKLLRIDPRPARRGFRVPPGNPLVGVPGANAIYSWGLRNPWRFSFDRLTGTLAIADVGDNEHAREEINILDPASAARSNFGWPEYEGFRLRDPARPGTRPLAHPVHTYGHKGSRCAITGGYVVRDPGLPRLYGRYLYADYCGGRIRSLVPPPAGAGAPDAPVATGDRDEGLYLRFPSSFGEGAAGEIYAVSHAGPLYRLRARR